MGSRSRKMISMVQHNNFTENSTLVETWLDNFDTEKQLNDHNYSLETVHPSINTVPSTLNSRKTDLSTTDNPENYDDGEIVTTKTVNFISTLQTTMEENPIRMDRKCDEISTDSKNNIVSNCTEIDPSLVASLHLVNQNIEVNNIPRQDINISLNNEIPSDNVEDVYVSDGSEYEPPKKKQPFKKVYPSAHNSSNSDSSSSSSCSSSSGSTSSGLSSSKSNSGVLFKRNHNVVPETTEPSTIPKSKKRTRNPTQWKKHQAKYLKNCGQAYMSSRGKAMAEKKIRPPCTTTCRLSCSKSFSPDERNTIFRTYWALGSFQRQRDFLASCIRQVEPEFRVVRIPKGGDVNRKCRKPNTSYFFVNKGKEVRVCKKFLINTLAISEKPLRTVIDGKFGNVSGIQTDKRGKHGNQSKLETEVIESVRDHINSIPRIESHYVRANSNREYIDGGLTVAELHRNYSENRLLNNKKRANYDAYHRIFNTQFNISFFIPRKDQCDVCEMYKNAVDKEPLSSSYKLHQEEKSLSRIEKKQDLDECKKPDSNITVAIFDLQAVLPCPIGQSSAFFYKSKLNCYNFTVSNMKEEKTFCFFWHEGLGKRGANEIGSCVFNFLKDYSSRKPNSDIIYYSDNCCGQQKNKFFLNMYYYAISTLSISTITHKFLIRGHTQNEADAVHSVIEKNIRRAKKSGPIYSPDQYVSLIRNAKKSGNSYVVNEMNFDNFYDLKLLSSDVNLNTIKNIDGEIIKVSEIKAVKFVKDSDTYMYKTTYKNQDWHEAKIKISRTGKKNIKDVSLSAAYKSKLPIPNNKKEDIRQLISSNIVPSFYANLYNSLFD